MAKAMKRPMTLENITNPPELLSFSFSEYFEMRYWSAMLTNAHRNGAPKAMKNHCISGHYIIPKLESSQKNLTSRPKKLYSLDEAL